MPVEIMELIVKARVHEARKAQENVTDESNTKVENATNNCPAEDPLEILVEVLRRQKER